jgi:oxygen-independent coproporphyrinogen-3 oxidase
MSALEINLEYELERFNVQIGDIESIFIGGGTPSTIEPDLYKNIFKKLNRFIDKDIEITVEANPNSASINWLDGIFNLGVNRISFGVQSFNNKKLKILNRTHSSKDAVKAIQNANRVGFKNISIDLIYGLSSDTEELLKDDIDRAFNLPINHISTYELTIEDNTKFSKNPNIKIDNDNLGYLIRDEVSKRGFEQYEVSNYGRYKSIHNLGYWQLKDYIGVGAGAVGFLKDKRLYPNRDILEYIKKPKFIKNEELTQQDIFLEKIFLGLRSEIGVKKDILTDDIQRKANILVEEGKLTLENNIYKNKNFFISDEIALYLIG